MSTRELEYLRRITRTALAQAGVDQMWSRYDDARAVLALIEKELKHRAEQLAEHPTLF